MNSEEVIRRLDITYRQLNNWVTVGYVKPMSGGGTGHRFEFSSQEFLVMERMVALVKAGVRLNVAVGAARGESEFLKPLVQAVNECAARADLDTDISKELF